MKSKIRMPRVTVAMCEEKIAHLEEENEMLSQRIKAGGEIGFTVDQMVDLLGLLNGCREYIGSHVCPSHEDEANAIVRGCAELVGLLSASAHQTFGTEAIHTALALSEAESMLAGMRSDQTLN